MLLLGQIILGGPGKRIGDLLVEERLLALEHELLVAQRAHRQPSQQQAGHEYGQCENQGDFFHNAGILSAFRTIPSSLDTAKPWSRWQLSGACGRR